jgi:hypothetical protein
LARQFKKDSLETIEELAPGSSDILPTLQTFLREQSAVPVDVINKLGLTDDMTSLGAKAVKSGDISLFSRNDLQKLISKKGWTKASNALNKELDGHFETLRNLMNDADVGLDIPYLENYITHFWDIAPKKAKEMASKWSRSAVFKNKRKFIKAIEGLSKGHKLKYENSLDIAKQYQLISARLIQNSQIVKTISDKTSKIIVDGKQLPLMMTANQVAKHGVDDLYVKVTNERALRVIGKSAKAFKDKAGKARTSVPKSVYIPKELARGFDVMFGDPFTNAAANFATGFNATAKSMSLMSSFFHSAALIESSMASLGVVKGLTTAGRLGFGFPGLSKAMKKVGLGVDEVALFKDVADEAIAHGLKATRPSDPQFEAVMGAFDSMEKAVSKIPGADKITGLGKGYVKAMDKALWADFHNPMKLVAYQKNLARAVKKNPNVPLPEIKRQVASFVNDAFGGQNWEQLMVSPKFKQILHWALLAPDWTISNMRIAGIGSTGMKGVARGFLGQGRNVSEQLVGQYWRRALPAFFGSAILLNKSLSGKWPWENAPGHMWDIDTGERDEKGRIEYVKLGKQFREPLRWLTEPWKIGGAKMAPAVQTLVEQFTGHSASGFPTDFAGSKQSVPMTVMEEVPLRAEAFVKKFIPFSFQGNSYMMALPKSTFNNTDAIRAVSDAIKDGDGKSVREILKLAKANGLNLSYIKSQVQRGTGDPRGFMQEVK